MSAYSSVPIRYVNEGGLCFTAGWVDASVNFGDPLIVLESHGPGVLVLHPRGIRRLSSETVVILRT